VRHLASILMLAMHLAPTPLPAKAQPAGEVAATRQPSMIYLPAYVIERQRLSCAGTPKTLPQAWTDRFFPISADLEGS